MNFSTGETEGDSLKEAFTAHLVLPDVVDRLPGAKLLVSYSDHVSIELGNLVMPEYINKKPMISMEMFNEKKYYTLIMSDPDTPNRAMPSDREFLYWMVTNITGNLLEKGEEVVQYEAPLPKKGSGLHRYVFVLLEQSRPIVFEKTNVDSVAAERAKSSVRAIDSSSISENEQDLKSRMSNQLNVGLNPVKRSISSSGRQTSGTQFSRETSPPEYDYSSNASKSIVDKNGKVQEHKNGGSNANKNLKEAVKLVPDEKKRLSMAGENFFFKGTDQKSNETMQTSFGKPSPSSDMTNKNVSGGDKYAKSMDQKSSIMSKPSLLGDMTINFGDGRDLKDQKFTVIDNQQLSKQTNPVAKQLSKSWLSSSPANAHNEEKETAVPEFNRTKFSTKDFITKYLIRSVAAGNFFQTEFNDYVGEKLTKSQSIDKEKQIEKLTAVMSSTTTAISTTKTVMTTLEKKIERSQNTRK